MIRWYRVSAILCIAICVYACGVRGQSGSWGDGHKRHHEDHYQRWERPDKPPGDGWSCCSVMREKDDGDWEGDCRPVRAYLGDDGLHYVFLSGKWKPVPVEKVMKIESPDGYAHVCANRNTDEVYCFVMGKPLR